MNALDREIRKGEEIVILKERMREEYQDIESRIFVAEWGFGMQTFTAGSKIFGYYKIDGERTFIYGEEISPAETKAWQNARPLIVHSPHAGIYAQVWKRVIEADNNNEDVKLSLGGGFTAGAPKVVRREFIEALNKRINARGDLRPRGKKDSDEYFINLRRDKWAIQDHYRSRIIIRSFNTPEVRKRLAHLITEYDE